KKGRVVAGTPTPLMLSRPGVSGRARAAQPHTTTVVGDPATLLAGEPVGDSPGFVRQRVAARDAQRALARGVEAKNTCGRGRAVPLARSPSFWRGATLSLAFSRPTSWSARGAPTMWDRCRGS